MKKNTFYYLFIFLFLMTGIVWQSCELEDLKDKWKPAYSIPLAYASLKMEDLMPNDEKINQALYTDENGLLHLTYEDRILELEAKDFIELINQNFQDDYEITENNVNVFGATPENSEVQIMNKPYNYTFNSEQQIEQKIDEIVFKSGTMKISVVPDLSSPINLAMDITIAALKNENNEPYVLLVDGAEEVHEEVDLSSYRLDLTNDNSNQNAMEIFYNLRFKKESGDVIFAGDKINLVVNMEDIEFSFVRGFFGKKEIARNEIVNLDMGKLVSNGELFIDPIANFKVNSNLGVPIQVLIPKLDAVIENENNTEILRINLPEAFPLDLEAPENMNDSIEMTINLLGDAPYPDLFDAIGRFPKYLDLNAKASINANSDPNTTTNFFSENTRIKVDLNVDLPLAFAAKFTMKDTIDVDFAGIDEDDLGKIDSVILQIIVDNEFPIDLSFQTYFIEEKGNVIELVDSIFDIPMKITNDIEESIIKISYKSNRIDKLKNVKRAIFVASVQTSEFEKLDNEGGHILKEVFGEQSISFYLSTNVWLSPAAE